MREGCIAGLPLWEMEELTWGEVTEVILARREGQRRQAQERSFIAYQQAGLIARAVTEGKMPEIYEVFPFWKEEEIREMKVERYRAIMERYAAQKVAKNEKKGGVKDAGENEQ